MEGRMTKGGGEKTREERAYEISRGVKTKGQADKNRNNGKGGCVQVDGKG